MSNNHFFIGLGSTGGNIIREIRKQVHVREAFFDDMKKNHGLALDYLYIDSSYKALSANWSVLGRDISLDKNKLKDIKPVNIAQILNDANNRPAILPWLGEKTFINDIVGKVAGTPGANQRRRFGRLLFANGASGILADITRAVQNLQTEAGQVGVNFHLLGTLGGGTGSGSIVDMALMLRSTYSETDYPITAYVLVTDNPGNANVGYFFQNQYSTLCDLNTLLASKNVNFELLTDPLGQKYDADKFGKALKHCYIVTDKSESGQMLPKDMQEKTLADWLLQTISVMASNDDPDYLKIYDYFTGENLLATHPGESDDWAIGSDRSYAFSSLGIKHWMSPEELIKTHAANAFARSLLEAFCYRNYTGSGYHGALLPANSRSYLASTSYKSMGLELSDICKENEVTGVEAGSFTKYYHDVCINAVKNQSLAAKMAEETVEAIDERLESEWNREFAGRGVEAYYNEKEHLNGMKDDVDEQIKHILEPLQDALLSGKLGVVDVRDVINVVCTKVKELEQEVQKSVDEAEGDRDNAKQRYKESRNKFRKAGFLARLFSNEELRNSYILEASDYYAARTRLRAYKYAGKYLKELKVKFDNLSNNVEKLAGKLVGVINSLQNEIVDLPNKLDQLRKVGSNKYVFQQQRVDDFINTAKQDKALFDRVLKSEVASLFNLHCDSNRNGQNWLTSSFDHLNPASQCLDWGNSVRDSFEKSSGERLCPGIIEALYGEIGNNPNECKKQCDDFMKEADVLLQIDHAAPQPGAVIGLWAPTMPKKSILIGMPVKNPKFGGFYDLLEARLRGAISNADVHIVRTAGNDAEITVTVCVSYMAARFAACLSTLKRKYDQSVDENTKSREQVLYFCHLDDDYAQREKLFLPSGEQSMRRFELVIKMGKLLGVVLENNGNNVIIVTKDGIRRAEELCPILLDNTPAKAIKGICEKIEKQLHGIQGGEDRIREIYKQQLEAIGDPLSNAYVDLLKELDDMTKLSATIFG